MSRWTSEIAERRALATLVACVVVGKLGMDSHPRQVPFIPLLDAVGSAEQWRLALDLLWAVGVGLLLLPAWRIGSLLAGSVELLRVLSNMPLFSNGRTLDALVLILAGLAGAGADNRRLRVQYLLVYVGASLNKLLDPHWRDGTFVMATLHEHLPAAQLPGWTAFAPAAGWITMLTELSIFLLLLRPATRRIGVLLVLGFHTGLLFVLHEDFGTFYYTVALGAVLLFYPFASVSALTIPSPRWEWLARHSCLTVIQSAPVRRGPWSLTWGAHHAHGMPALAILAIACLPIAAVVCLTALTVIGYPGSPRLREAGVLVTIATLGLLWVATHPRFTRTPLLVGGR